MNNLWQVDTLYLFLTFFIPGFVSLNVHDLFVPGERRDYVKSLYGIIGYSFINYALIGCIGNLFFNNFDPTTFERFGWEWVLVTIVIPAIWPYAYIKIITFEKLGDWKLTKWITNDIAEPYEKAWDWLFRKRKVYWVIVHLKDGRRIGGIYGKNSYASSNTSTEQIYIQEVWDIDENDNFLEPIPCSQGVLIVSDQIANICFYGNNEGGEKHGE